MRPVTQSTRPPNRPVRPRDRSDSMRMTGATSVAYSSAGRLTMCGGGPARSGRGPDRQALSSASMSSFFMPSMAFMARSALARSGSESASDSPRGTICQDSPYLSLSQPH